MERSKASNQAEQDGRTVGVVVVAACRVLVLVLLLDDAPVRSRSQEL